MAECICNGHQIGCPLNAESGIYECVCGGNTVGQFCERCIPNFNQKAWQFGVPCEECNCHNHTNECTYVEELETNQQSLNKQGQLIGGGQCLNCKDNTAGVNCEKCKPFYYRPTGVAQSSPDVCVLCGCNNAGSTASPLSGVVGDCVMNSDVAPSGMQPGNCYCKTNVIGTKCDQCNQGFFNIDENNPDGCQACACNTAGTVGANPVCSPSSTGECSCKQNVEGRACDVCKDGFYGLSADDQNGCRPCDCDPGGAVSPTCEKVSGQCVCRPNLQGRQCDSPVVGFYFPDPHFIYVDFESVHGTYTLTELSGYQGDGYITINVGDIIDPALIFPGGTTFSGTCAMLIRYSAQEMTSATLQIDSSDDPRPMMVTFPACPNQWCTVNIADIRNITLQGSTTHTCRFIAMGEILLDRLVCLPAEFLETDSLLGSDAFSTNCNVLTNDMRRGTALESTCSSGLLSLMSFYLNGLRSCDCSTKGSQPSTDCEPNGGACVCKAGVGKRRCDQCKPGYYQLSDTGCRDCDCAATTGLCDVYTGQCQCPPNTIGLKCDHCDFNTWGWDQKTGCKDCNCNMTGSERGWCNITTGVCTCKVGVEGTTCDSCMDTYKQFTSLGCSRCDCNVVGSTSDVCDKENGQCSCKENVEGLFCNTCKTGSFTLDTDNPKGCLDCICMGVSSVCFSNTGRHRKKSVTPVESVDGVLTATLTVADSDGINLATPAVEVPDQTDTMGTPTSVKVVVPKGGSVYWRVPDLFGNLLQVYGGSVQADVLYSPIALQGTTTPTRVILIGRNNKRLVKNIEIIPSNQTTPIKFFLKESEWLDEVDLSSVTRENFLLALTDVKVILVPAAFSSEAHVSFLTHLAYSVDDTVGENAQSVEKCDCSLAYTGLSCERCADGFKRVNASIHPFLGECVPCECNNHASLCDPDTGDCINCQHDTTGTRCEQCALGFFGDATLGTTLDCNECQCYEPRVANKSCIMVDGSIKCLYCNPGYKGDICDSCEDFHYGNPVIIGGSCTPCNCNGNSDQCNPLTGECIGCGNNTEGFNCEQCITGYYKNTASNTCEVCGCDDQGSENTICDPSDGTCLCYPGIGGRTCNSCLDNYWGFSVAPSGCQPCQCVEAGSTSLQCEPDNGQCSCKLNVLSETGKCEKCVAGYFGLPNQECQVCGCDSTGTDPMGGTCDLVSGQCPCKPGVTGRRCDRCKTLYTGFSATGCTACDQCQSSLGNDTTRLHGNWSDAYEMSQDVVGIQAQDRDLQNLTQDLNTTMASLGLSGTDITSVSELTDNITQIEADTNQQVVTLQNKVIGLKLSTGGQKDDTYTEDERLKIFLGQSLDMLDLAREEELKAVNYQYELNEFNISAQQYLGQGLSGQTGAGLNFNAQLTKATTDYQKINDDTSIKDMQVKTSLQASVVNFLLKEEEIVRERFNSESDKMSQTWYTNLTELENNENHVFQELTQSREFKLEAQRNIAEIVKATESINNISTTAAQLFVTAVAAHGACQEIMTGNATQVLPGVVFPLNVTNWQTGYQELQTLHGRIVSQVSTTDDDVKETERQAQELDTDAKLLNTTFYDIQLRGDAAVKAIANFEKVILSLNSSVDLADAAKSTIAEAQQALAAVTVAGLEAEANSSLIQSNQVLDSLNSVRYNSAVLNSRLDGVDFSMKAAMAQWPAIDGQLEGLQQVVETLIPQSAGSDIDSIITEAQGLAAEANRLSGTTMSTLTQLNSTLSTERFKAEDGKSQVDRAVNLTRSVEQEILNFPGTVENLKTTVETAGQHLNSIQQNRPFLDSKIISIEEKLQQAKQLLAKFRKPVHFNGTSGVAVENNLSGVARSFTDVQFKFKKDQSVKNSLLFFLENTANTNEFSLEVVNDQVQMQFSGPEGTATITSKAQLCHDCWFQLQASKYHAVGHLTLILLSTGGTASDYALSSSENTDNMLTFNSPLLFGSLPPGTTSIKLKSNNGFLGCIHDVRFNGEDIDIWDESIKAGEIPTCCRTPVISSPTLDQGTSFSGFGELILSAEGFDAALVQTVSLMFRTFSPNAVLLLVAGDNLPVKFSIHLSDGNLVFEYGTVGAIQNRLQSANKYNTGQWFKVSATKSTMNKLDVFSEDGLPAETVTPMNSNNVDLSQLSGSDFTIGSDKTTNSVNSPSNRFSGCMKEFSYTYSSSPVFRSFQVGIVSESGVSHSGCPAKVISGMNFLSESSYLKVNLPTVTTITKIELKLATTQANGVLLYIQDTVTTSKILYLSLFNGNLLFENRGTSTLSTTSPYISDGLLHTIVLDITNSPLIEIDDNNQYTGSGLAVFTKTGETPVFIGGSESFPDDEFPVRSSFIGGITSLKINENEIDIYQGGIIVGQQESDLGGIPEPPNAPPPLPYTTPEPPPIPTCGDQPVTPGPSNTFHLWFVGNGYWKKALSDSEKEMFKKSFSLSIEFEAFGPDGVLLLAANSAVSPSQYIMLYLRDGYLYFEVKGSDGYYKSLKSLYKYNNGVKYTVDLLVYGTYLIMTESLIRKDYIANDQGQIGSTHIFTDIQDVTVGGLPNPTAAIPLLPSLPSSTGFQGGVSEVTVHSKNVGTVSYDLQSTDAVTSANIRTYPGPDIGYGVHLDGYNSYIQFDTITVNGQLDVSLKLRNIAPSAMLFYIYQAENSFVALDTVEYRIRVTVGSTTSSAGFSVTSTDLTNFCDGLSHTYLLTLNTTGVGVKVDGNTMQFTNYPDNFPVPSLIGLGVVGGLTDPQQRFQEEVSTLSVRGCVEHITINGVIKEPAFFFNPNDSKTSLGCPYVDPYGP